MSQWGDLNCAMHVASSMSFYSTSCCMQTDGLTVQEVVEALRHHLAMCQHNTGKKKSIMLTDWWVKGGR